MVMSNGAKSSRSRVHLFRNRVVRVLKDRDESIKSIDQMLRSAGVDIRVVFVTLLATLFGVLFISAVLPLDPLS